MGLSHRNQTLTESGKFKSTGQRRLFLPFRSR